MAHYVTLREFRFEDVAGDIRGATVYDIPGNKIGKIQDVVFDHGTGEIRYVVVAVSGDKEVLIPPERLFRSVAREEDFDTNLTRQEIEQLPAFDESMLHAADWPKRDEAEQRRWEEIEKRLLAEYKEKYDEGPVAHRKGSDRIVTPDEEELPAASGTAAKSQESINAADLWPERIAGKFPAGQPITAPGGVRARAGSEAGERTTLTPASSADWAETAGRRAADLGPRWERFEQNLQRYLPRLRTGCTVCVERERVA